jgi:hypothetical protein
MARNVVPEILQALLSGEQFGPVLSVVRAQPCDPFLERWKFVPQKCVVRIDNIANQLAKYSHSELR